MKQNDIEPFQLSRQRFLLNRDWQFSYLQGNQHKTSTISLPHTHKEIAYNGFDETCYQFVSTYETTFYFDILQHQQRLILHFEGVMTYAKVWLNDVELGEHFGGYTPFSFDVTGWVNQKGENKLKVLVDGTERKDIPPFGFVIDYLTYAGIYRDVFLEVVSEVSVERVKTRTENVLLETKSLVSEVFLYIPEIPARTQFSLEMALFDAAGECIERVIEPIVLAQKGSVSMEMRMDGLSNIQLWDCDYPMLYEVRFYISNNKEREVIDVYSHKVGFRTAEFRTDGFFLNNQRCILRGLNRHQSYPYVGYAMPKRAQEDDATLLKYDLGLNCVRTSHYPQSVDFLNRCDEIGLLVFEEMPGWQHIGDSHWQDVACTSIQEMIERDYNHPSIILWGVRINESGDHHDFYTRTNQLAHALDTTRPTGGVRCITGSEFLEDVYTFNDFILGNPLDIDGRVLRPQLEATGLNKPVPYLVTEYAGHMYPTKRFDQIQRQEEHVRRHLAVVNDTALTQFTSGSIGWCAFDYNTHYQFGSGDRICYHGVMDMFRIPKFAAFGYTSQIDPSKMLVLEPVLIYAMGEKNFGGVTPMTILTNVEYVDYFVGESLFGRYYPATTKYPGLKHPPILIEGIADVWGSGFENVEFKGYINDAVVIQRNYIKNPHLTGIHMTVDHDTLTSLEADTTRVVIEAVDQIGNRMPFVDVVVTLEINGPASIIGPSTFSLLGGCRAFWIKTHFEPGEVEITAKIMGASSEMLESYSEETIFGERVLIKIV